MCFVGVGLSVINAVKARYFMAIVLGHIEGRRNHTMKELHESYDGDIATF